MRKKPRLDVPRAVRWPSTQVVQWLRARLAAAGADVADVPDMPFRFLALPAVMEMTGLSSASIYRMMGEKTFPRGIPVDRASVRGVEVSA